MKFLLLSGLLIGLTLFSFAQTKNDSLSNRIQQQAEAVGQGGNNELKINVLFMALGLPEITYERIVGTNRGIGVALVMGTNNDYWVKYAVNPFYRWYFGQQKAIGFFMEGNLNAIYKEKRSYNHYENRLNLGIGAAAGAKFFTRNSFFGEVYLGYSRTLGGARLLGTTYPRMGITIGKRFP